MKIALTIVGFLSVFNITHHTHEVIYQFSDYKENLQLVIKVENSDLEMLLPHHTASTIVEGRAYFKEHFSCKVDDQPVDFKFTSTETNRKWTTFTYNTTLKTVEIEKIELFNDAFTDYYEEFQNSIYFKFGSNYKSYKMTAERTSINVIL